MSAEQASLFDQRVFPRPTARRRDPIEAKVAAASIEPANQLLVVAIRQCVRAHGAQTQFDIARRIVDEYEGRWSESSVRTACARAGLVKVGTTMVGKRPYGLYDVPKAAS